jgi:hypothetical protein
MFNVKDLPFLLTKANVKNQKVSGMDTPKDCLLGPQWWYSYPHFNDIEYSYNSLGFRDAEFDQTQKVLLCLGDSFTVNIGGVNVHSWSRQLEKKSNKKCVNLGIDGAGNDLIALIAQRSFNFFDVEKTCVVFSFLHRHYIEKGNEKHRMHHCLDDYKNFKRFEKNFEDILHLDKNFKFTFLPDCCYTETELSFLKNYKKLSNNITYKQFDYHPKYKNFKDLVDSDRKKYTNKKIYNIYRSNNWPTFSQWIKGADPHPDMFTEQFETFLNPLTIQQNLLATFNRDGFHFAPTINSEIANKMLDKFYF